ncbi:MAG: hypothetical protein AAFP26_03465, partial [Planctomycetota bacterium]
EIQRSKISADDVLTRNAFYGPYCKSGQPIWVFDASKFIQNVRWHVHPEIPTRVWFRWSWRRRTHEAALRTARVFWDFGEPYMLEILRLETFRWFDRLPYGRIKHHEFHGEGCITDRYGFILKHLGDHIDLSTLRVRAQRARPDASRSRLPREALPTDLLEIHRDKLFSLVADG